MDLEERIIEIGRLFDYDTETDNFKDQLLGLSQLSEKLPIKKQQIFLEFAFSDFDLERFTESMLGQLEIAVQILINNGYTFIVCNSEEKSSTECEKFVELFKSGAIKYDKNSNGGILNDHIFESELLILTSFKYMLYAFVFKKPFISFYVNKKAKELLAAKTIFLDKEELNAGDIVKSIQYVRDNYDAIKKELSMLFGINDDKKNTDLGVDNKEKYDYEDHVIVKEEQNSDFESYKRQLKENIQYLVEEGFLSEAKQIICEYEEIVDSDIDIYSIKGVIAMMEGNLDEAERVLKEGFTINRAHFDINYNLGYLYQIKEEKQSAIEYYRKALQNAEKKVDVDDVTSILKSLEVEVGTEIRLEKDPKSSEVSQFEDNVTIINTDEMEAPSAGSDLYTSRENIYANFADKGAKPVTIVIQGYNRLEKTKYCVECVLNYTKEIDFELILIDNGSNDGTFEYFKSVKFKYKKVVRITKNVGSVFGYLKFVFNQFNGKYLVAVPDDAYVTVNWLSNLLKCMESDNKIGWVMPMSSNISNLQDPGLNFDSMEEMQEVARKFNVSDPLKWEKRLRLINIITVFKREVIDLVGKYDVGFFHDFSEDDYSIRLRRMGYRLVLCGDTFVHHDHDFINQEDKDPVLFKQSLEKGKNNFKEKHFSLDPWDDINNFERNLIGMLPLPYLKKSNKKEVRILGIDVRCGTPILEIENYLNKNNIKKISSSAFTTQAKYYLDLKTICGDHVDCDRIEYISEYLNQESYDYIIVGEPINTYIEPVKVLYTLLNAAKKGSKILFKLINNNDVNKLLEIAGVKKLTYKDVRTSISLDAILEILKSKKITNIKIMPELYHIDSNNVEMLKKALENITQSDDLSNVLKNILTSEYLMCIER